MCCFFFFYLVSNIFDSTVKNADQKCSVHDAFSVWCSYWSRQLSENPSSIIASCAPDKQMNMWYITVIHTLTCLMNFELTVGWLWLFKLVHLASHVGKVTISSFCLACLQRKRMFCHCLYYLKIKMLLIKLTVRVVTATDAGSDSAAPHPSPQPHINKRTCGGKAGSVFEQTPHHWFQTSLVTLSQKRRCRPSEVLSPLLLYSDSDANAAVKLK